MNKYLITTLLLLFTFAGYCQPETNTKNFITYKELLNSLQNIIKTKIESSEVIRQEFKEFQKSHGISNDDKTYQEFVIVRSIFEATRDSGLWQIRWTVTDREPNSDAIWKQWNNAKILDVSQDANLSITAEAECDELSALFALITRDLGVKQVGLFWPTWNHTVAVWTTRDAKDKPVRIIVPTSQVFLTANATLGTNEFDPYQQKTIYNYTRKDVQPNHKIPLDLATMMITQLEKYGAKPSFSLQKRRNQLSRLFGGS